MGRPKRKRYRDNHEDTQLPPRAGGDTHGWPGSQSGSEIARIGPEDRQRDPRLLGLLGNLLLGQRYGHNQEYQAHYPQTYRHHEPIIHHHEPVHHHEPLHHHERVHHHHKREAGYGHGLGYGGGYHGGYHGGYGHGYHGYHLHGHHHQEHCHHYGYGHVLCYG